MKTGVLVPDLTFNHIKASGINVTNLTTISEC